MTVWITADWHLGEDRFELIQRPFETATQMVYDLLENHNRLVKPEDHVIVVGDVCYQKAPEYLKMVGEFNGTKTLIRGNHDRVFSDDDLKPYFHSITAEGDGLEVTVEDIPCYITHYPTGGRVDRFNLVGHIHGAWKYQLNTVNVGVDVNHFRPVNLEQKIPFYYKAIKDFYDQDVWVGYDPINESYKSSRGKKSRYFDAGK